MPLSDRFCFLLTPNNLLTSSLSSVDSFSFRLSRLSLKLLALYLKSWLAMNTAVNQEKKNQKIFPTAEHKYWPNLEPEDLLGGSKGPSLFDTMQALLAGSSTRPYRCQPETRRTEFELKRPPNRSCHEPPEGPTRLVELLERFFLTAFTHFEPFLRTGPGDS